MLEFGDDHYSIRPVPVPNASFQALTSDKSPLSPGQTSTFIVTAYEYPHNGDDKTAQISLQPAGTPNFWAMKPSANNSDLHLVVIGTSPSSFPMKNGDEFSNTVVLWTDEGASSTGLRVIVPFEGGSFLAYGLPNKLQFFECQIVG